MFAMLFVKTFLLGVFGLLVCYIDRADCRNADAGLKNTLSDDEQNIGETCFSDLPFTCVPEYRFRTIDGSCSASLDNPSRGWIETAHTRLLAASYKDNIKELQVQSDGSMFPSARVLSNAFFSDIPDDDPRNLDKNFTMSLMVFGQLLSHDIIRNSGKPGSSCCTDDHQVKNDRPDNCKAILVPTNDPFYSKFNTTCLNFRRLINTDDKKCNLAPVLGINFVTCFIDASPLYGTTEEANQQIRLNQGGLLISREINGSIFPPNVQNSTGLCVMDEEPKLCLQSGDTVRTNSHPMLAIMQTIMLRFHNWIATELANLNPHWTDDSHLFEEARRIVIACLQQITFKDYLPNIIGYAHLEKIKCGSVKDTGYHDVYDPTVNPQILTEFTGSAFRSLHSCIVDRIRMYDERRIEVGHWNLSDFFNHVGFIAEGDNFENIIIGMTKDPQGNLDRFFTTSITDLLFQVNGLGADLESLDIERARDMGIASYPDYLEMIGQPRPNSWEDYKKLIPDDEMIERLKAFYASHQDVELFLGGVLEADSTGSQMGPTFQALIAEQFCRLQIGDRFYFEANNQPYPFTEQQLEQIRNVTLSLLYCITCPKLVSMQPDAFRLYSENNILMPCTDIISKFTLKPWEEVSQ